MSYRPEDLARTAALHPWRTVLAWLVVLATSIALTSAFLGDALTTSADFTDQPESKRAAQLIEEVRGPNVDTELIVVTSEEMTVDDATYQSYVAALQAAVTRLGPETVLHVGSYLTGNGPVSESAASTLLPVTLAGADSEALETHAAELKAAVASVAKPPTIQATVAGPTTLEAEVNRIAEEDLATGEMVGLAVALIVLVIVFGTIAAGVIPIVLGMTSIAVALGGAALVGLAFELSFFVTNMITMIGLAVGIDYSLFIVSRYREERAAGLAKVDAITRAGATASRAVLWSGLTVVLALVGMLLLPNTIFRSLGIGAILVVMIAVAASMTLLPAVLSLMGDKVDALRVRRRPKGGDAPEGRFWDRLSSLVMRRPVASLTASTGLLIALALPASSMATGFSGVSTLPDDIASKQAFTVLEHEFAGGLTAPIEIVVEAEPSPAVREAIDSLQSAVEIDRSFGSSAVETSPDGRITIVTVALQGDVNSAEALTTVRALRQVTLPTLFDSTDATVLVGGETAISVDFVSQVNRYTPIVLIFVLALSFILLTVAFRSVVIPLKAITMNLLSVAAAYGLVVGFFQEGTGPAWMKSMAGWFGFSQVEVIEAWLPLFLFSVLFGLSMDYHVFLLSRIRENFDRTKDNGASVAHGLRSTGALITGAAAIMVAVFSGFAAGRLVSFQQMGFGLAVAVLLDATIVRSILVPASMKLLGNRNWYLPRWLDWLPTIEIESSTQDAPEDLVPVA